MCESIIAFKGRANKYMGLDVWWWVRNLCHIETLFFLAFFIALIYFFCTANKKREHDSDDEESYESEDEGDKLTISAFRKIFKKHPRKSKTHTSKAFKKKKNGKKNEKRCREIFEEIFDVPFKTIRPEWLMNPTSGENLEIDGFNESIKTPIGRGLGFEYNGRQHSEYVPYFHRKGVGEFRYQMAKDGFKNARCKEKKIMLINIPHYIHYHDLERYIKQQLRQKGMGDYLSGNDGKGGIYD